MEINVNGKTVKVKDEFSLLELINDMNLNVKVLAVELNGCIVDKGNYENTLLKQSDKLEIVSFVGGG